MVVFYNDRIHNGHINQCASGTSQVYILVSMRCVIFRWYLKILAFHRIHLINIQKVSVYKRRTEHDNIVSLCGYTSVAITNTENSLPSVLEVRKVFRIGIVSSEFVYNKVLYVFMCYLFQYVTASYEVINNFLYALLMDPICVGIHKELS